MTRPDVPEPQTQALLYEKLIADKHSPGGGLRAIRERNGWIASEHRWPYTSAQARRQLRARVAMEAIPAKFRN